MKKSFSFIALLLPAAMLFTACDKGAEEGTPATITVPGNQNLTPTVFADNEGVAASVDFTTAAPWTSSIAGSAVRSSVSDLPSTSWVTIVPASGGAGKHKVEITLDPNTSGEDRAATITIDCDGEKIDITITQKGTKADGTTPVEAEYGGSGNFIYNWSTVSLPVDGARQSISAVNSAVNKARVTFYKNGVAQDDALYLEFHMAQAPSRLIAGTYRFSPTPVATNNSFFAGKGTIGTKGYTANGGTVTVSLSGNTYTLDLNITVASDDGVTGTITGKYTGYVTGGVAPAGADPITIRDEANLVQTVYADNTCATDLVFTTTGAWTSAIRGITSAVIPDWITPSPASGAAAGQHSMSFALNVNRTGEERTGWVAISCGGKTKEVKITQKAVRADGTPPPAEQPSGGTGNFIFSKLSNSLVLDGATQTITNDATGRRALLTFYSGGVATDAVPLTLTMPATYVRLLAGTYNFSTMWASTVHVCFFQYGIFNGHQLTPQSGSVTVGLDGDTYAITLNLNVVDASSNPYTLTGTYTGYIPVVTQ